MFFVGSRGIVDCLLIFPTGPGRNAYNQLCVSKLPEATHPIRSLVNRGVRLVGNKFVTITNKIYLLIAICGLLKLITAYKVVKNILAKRVLYMGISVS